MSPEEKLDQALRNAERSAASLADAIRRNMAIMWLLGFGIGMAAGLAIGTVVLR